MSTKENDRLIEELEVWLHENDFWFHEAKFDDGVYFERGGLKIPVPDNLQEICLLIKK